ncbi:TetR/AcrR family transcriptional regulator [Tomitella fengzijianii]|uniref:TetR/AcrR family transcriptional regulator n=1 Tax=Tomitella fengzijianii TaxID=2597660 RepID=UPI00131DB40F|nr:TetR/AcrR family transcriptional regulator [Tomitella fengzijianii]
MSSSPDQYTPKGQATRQRLIAAAREELRDTGGSIEVASVALRAGVSQGLLYRYFGAKDGLVAAVVHEFYDSYDRAVFAAASTGDLSWHERERLRLRWEIDFLCGHELSRIIVGRALSEPAAIQADAERLSAQIDLAARNVAAGQRSGELDPRIDARLVAAAFLGAFRELMAESLSRDVIPGREQLLEVIWRIGSAVVYRPADVESPTVGEGLLDP